MNGGSDCLDCEYISLILSITDDMRDDWDKTLTFDSFTTADSGSGRFTAKNARRKKMDTELGLPKAEITTTKLTFRPDDVGVQEVDVAETEYHFPLHEWQDRNVAVDDGIPRLRPLLVLRSARLKRKGDQHSKHRDWLVPFPPSRQTETELTRTFLLRFSFKVNASRILLFCR